PPISSTAIHIGRRRQPLHGADIANHKVACSEDGVRHPYCEGARSLWGSKVVAQLDSGPPDVRRLSVEPAVALGRVHETAEWRGIGCVGIEDLAESSLHRLESDQASGDHELVVPPGLHNMGPRRFQ